MELNRNAASTIKSSGASCSKLAMSIVNVLLELWSLNMPYMLLFLLENVSSFCIAKATHIFFSNHTCELDIVITRHHENIPIWFWPPQTHFYVVKLGFTGVYIIYIISGQKHRLWALIRTASARVF